MEYDKNFVLLTSSLQKKKASVAGPGGGCGMVRCGVREKLVELLTRRKHIIEKLN